MKGDSEEKYKEEKKNQNNCLKDFHKKEANKILRKVKKIDKVIMKFLIKRQKESIQRFSKKIN